MELREYLRVLLKNWWLIILLTLVGLSGALIFSYAQKPVYEATSTYVVSLAKFDSAGTTMYGMDTLSSSQQRIFATYCRLMDSNLVRDEAYKVMNIDTTQTSMASYDATCTVLPETNVLRLVTHGSNPEQVRRLNESIGVLGMAKAKDLYSLFPLQPLDSVAINATPISPNHPQNAALGAILGLVMGITLALASEYLRSPLERLESMSIRNPRLGIYNERYFQQRLVEEINRARTRNRPLSVAMMKLIPDEDFVLLPAKAQEALMRTAALWLQDQLQGGNIIAYINDGKNDGKFGLLLPEIPSDESYEVLQNLQNAVRSQTFTSDAYVTNFTARSGMVETSGGSLTAEQMKEKASQALNKTSGDHPIELVRTSPRPFHNTQPEHSYDGLLTDNGLVEPGLADGATD